MFFLKVTYVSENLFERARIRIYSYTNSVHGFLGSFIYISPCVTYYNIFPLINLPYIQVINFLLGRVGR